MGIQLPRIFPGFPPSAQNRPAAAGPADTKQPSPPANLPSAEQVQQLKDNADKLRQAPPSFSTTIINNSDGSTNAIAQTNRGVLHAKSWTQDGANYFTDLSNNTTWKIEDTAAGDKEYNRLLTNTATGQQIQQHVKYQDDGSADVDTDNDGVYDTHVGAATTVPDAPSTDAA